MRWNRVYLLVHLSNDGNGGSMIITGNARLPYKMISPEYGNFSVGITKLRYGPTPLGSATDPRQGDAD